MPNDPVVLKVRADGPAILTTNAEVEALRADNASLRTALQLVEYGSCDGCGNKNQCVECGARFHNWTEESGNVPELHAPDCAIGIALGRAK